jgi:hypothetical protein
MVVSIPLGYKFPRNGRPIDELCRDGFCHWLYLLIVGNSAHPANGEWWSSRCGGDAPAGRGYPVLDLGTEISYKLLGLTFEAVEANIGTEATLNGRAQSGFDTSTPLA